MKTKIHSLIGFFVLALSAAGQGNFENLNFELAIVPISQPSSPPGVPTVNIDVALPGWSASIGTNQASMVMYNSQTLDTSAVSLIRDNYPSLSVIEGNFSVFMLGGYLPLSTGNIADVSLWQTGLVPVGSQSIQFKSALGRVEISLDGQLLPKIPIQVAPGYILFGADVTPFAGQVRELRFSVFTPRDGGGGVAEILDSVSFSPDPIPEPSVFGLSVLAASLLGWCLNESRKS